VKVRARANHPFGLQPPIGRVPASPHAASAVMTHGRLGRDRAKSSTTHPSELRHRERGEFRFRFGDVGRRGVAVGKMRGPGCIVPRRGANRATDTALRDQLNPMSEEPYFFAGSCFSGSWAVTWSSSF
jgi:hypothetical protein